MDSCSCCKDDPENCSSGDHYAIEVAGDGRPYIVDNSDVRKPDGFTRQRNIDATVRVFALGTMGVGKSTLGNALIVSSKLKTSGGV